MVCVCSLSVCGQNERQLVGWDSSVCEVCSGCHVKPDETLLLSGTSLGQVMLPESDLSALVLLGINECLIRTLVC